MNRHVRRCAAFIALFVVIATHAELRAQVKTGADLLLTKHFELVKNKRIGLVTNHSAVLADGRLVADAIHERSGTKLVALFGPEHGIRGDEPAGHQVKDGKDAKTGVPVYSLYGAVSKPTDDMLKGVDVLVYDIQDVGARFYTYESTLSLTMEAAAEHNIPFIVLDRPNPIRGISTEGYIRLDSLRSFVGLNPTPVTHGMTVGELATMINAEGWLRGHAKANVTVVRMEGWKRDMWFDQTGLKWIRPSPNIKSLETAIVYPGTCLIEGTNLSEGRGTDRPFEYLGAPYIDGEALANHLNGEKLQGVRFEPVTFTPRSIPGVADKPKLEGLECAGIRLVVTNRDEYTPVRVGVHILAAVKNLFVGDFRWNVRGIDRLAGTPELRRAIDAGTPPEDIVRGWSKEVAAFDSIRVKYLLY